MIHLELWPLTPATNPGREPQPRTPAVESRATNPGCNVEGLADKEGPANAFDNDLNDHI